MNKITLYYTFLFIIVATQFVGSVVIRSSVVQQSAALVNEQKKLAQLEQQEAALVQKVAQQTALTSVQTASPEYIAMGRPVVLTPVSLVAAR